MELTAEWMFRVVSEGTLEERRALVDLLPAQPLKSTVRLLMDSPSPFTRLAALAALAQQYCFGGNPAVGAPLAAALHAHGTQIVDVEPAHGLLAITLSRLAYAHIRALALLRRLDDVMAVAQEYGIPGRPSLPSKG